MARGKKRRGKGPTNEEDDNRDPLEKGDMHNERFTAYYKAQHIIPDNEWDHFMETLRSPLPTTFRVAGSRETARVLNSAIEETYVPLLSNAEFEGERVPPPSQIPWYPEGLAWQFNVSKKVLRKSTEFKKFHSFLVFETEVGNISRQEAVSMLPPLFLDVQPHHKVIDMCAAPGSKTAQLLEALHAQDTATSTSTPPGLLIANDSDGKRAHLLIHQSARLPSPAFMVTNLDASIYPILRFPNAIKTEPRRQAKKTSNQLLFDRILCDVPCSGDGTLRKNVGIWKRWQPMDGNGLHGLQIRILQRAMRMLEDDGLIVYSTCSLNPVENEAVIAAALNSNTEFELVDVSEQLPELTRRPGITTWIPTVDRSINTTFSSWDAFAQSLPESKRLESKMLESHWPPSNVDTLHLSRCLRIYPHLQDTGGFFVAVLKKRPRDTAVSLHASAKREADEPVNILPETKKVKLESKEATPAQNSSDVNDNEMTSPVDTPLNVPPVSNEGRVAPAPSTSKPKPVGRKDKITPADGSFKEMPYTFLLPDDPALQSCIQQLSFTTEFPTSNVLVRNPEGEAVRSLYLTNDLVKTVVQNNDYTRMRLMTCGTKVVTKQEAGKGMDAQFRILGEGLPVVLPYANPEKIMTAEVTTLKILLETYYPLCAGFAEPFRSAIEARSTGSHIVRFPTGSFGDSICLSHDLLLPLWKSNVSVTLMIDKKAKSALSLRLFGEDITTAAREAAQKKMSLPGAPPPTDIRAGDEDVTE